MITKPPNNSQAVYTVNYPDPQASKNNGVVQKGPYTFQHDEIHRTTCINPDCQAFASAGLFPCQ